MGLSPLAGLNLFYCLQVMRQSYDLFVKQDKRKFPEHIITSRLVEAMAESETGLSDLMEDLDLDLDLDLEDENDTGYEQDFDVEIIRSY